VRAFENRVMRSISDPSQEWEITSGWGKLHNEELYNSYCSTNIIRKNKSRRMNWDRM
jgi:hypothetical protein